MTNMERLMQIGFRSLEEVAGYIDSYALNMLGFSKEEKEEIRAELVRNGVRTELSGEEKLLAVILCDNWHAPQKIRNYFLANPMTEEQKQALDLALEALPTEQKRTIVGMYFGLEDKSPLLYEQIAEKLKMTYEQVVELLKAAVQTLKYDIRLEAVGMRGNLTICKRSGCSYKESIRSLPIYYHSYVALRLAGIDTIEELKSVDLTKVQNLSPKGLEEVRKLIAS